MPHPHPAEPPRANCANCAASLRIEPTPSFCPACGQETALHPPSLREFLHEFAAHYVALEGALWRTLAALLWRPGRLTLEYFAGRRRRYVLPLRLYLTASFVFFLVVKVFGLGSGLAFELGGGAAAQQAPTIVFDTAAEERMKGCVARTVACSWSETLSARFMLKAASQADRPQAIVQRMSAMAPYAIFAMLPFFAGLVMAAYRSRRMLYGEHFVFSLHVHAFWFLALLASALLPEAASTWIGLLMAVYGVWALRTVYGGGIRGTLWRAVVISLGYTLALALGSAALAVAAIALG